MALALVRYIGRRALARLSRRFHLGDHGGEENEGDNCPICQEPPTDPACLPCLHVFCHECLNEYALRREMSAHEFIVQHLLGICIFSCPTCRTPIHKKFGTRLTFPPPKACGDCGNPIKRAYKFPNCGHVNEDRCITCMESYEGDGNVRCPNCLSVSERSSLENVYLCSTCRKFTSESVCKPCLTNLVSPYQTPQEKREYVKSEISTTFIIVLILVLLHLAINNNPGGSPPPVRSKVSSSLPNIERRIVSNNCFGRSPWFVDTKGRVFCEAKSEDKVIESLKAQKANAYSGKPEKTGADSEKTKKENGEAAEQKVKKKLVPIYQTDCYPARVWEVSPEGEIHTKKCEKVFVRYREE